MLPWKGRLFFLGGAVLPVFVMTTSAVDITFCPGTTITSGFGAGVAPER